MKVLTDYVISTQLCTFVAAILTYLAHLQDKGELANANWNFTIGMYLIIAMIMMILPYLFIGSEKRINA